MAVKKTGLGAKGRGMEALINTKLDSFEKTKENILEVDINNVERNPNQPRKHFKEEALEELAQSVKLHGIIQPIVVKKEKDYYVIIAGERRWRAAKIAGLKKVPVIVKPYSESEAFEIALIENLQREDLNPVEEAESYKHLLEDFNLSQEEIASKVGKSRSAVANSLRLLNLDERVREFLIEGKISNGHGRAILAIEDKDIQFETAEKVIEEELTVRETEKLVKDILEAKPEKAKEASKFKTGEYKRIENTLSSLLGTKVKLKAGRNKGKIEIEYYSDDELDRLLGILNK